MKKPIIIHVVWAAVAAIFFVVGSVYFSGDPVPDPSGVEGGAATRYTGRTSAAGDPALRRHARPASRDRQRVTRTGAGQWGKIDLSEKGIKSLGHLFRTSSDPVERRVAFSKLLQGLTAENAMLVREQIVHLRDNSQDWKDFHYAWGALAGEAAVEFASESEKRDKAACLGGWASADPRGALAWFTGLSEGEARQNDLKWGTVYGLSNADPRLATEFVMSRLESGDKDAGYMINLVAASVLREGSPMEAARWALTLPEGKLQNSAVSKVARAYASENPLEAVAWLESLPESQGQAKGLGAAYSEWAARDAGAAANRINQMKDSPARDSAVNGYSRRIAYMDPPAAVDWASSISDSRVRNETLIHTGRIYMRRDREAASKWLANSNLPADLQKRIQGSGRKRRSR